MNVKFNFNVNEIFSDGINNLSANLGYEQSSDGITVTAHEGSRIGVSLSEKKATVYYRKKHQFFRELSILSAKVQAGAESLDITEDGHFTEVAAMIDASRCAVPTVKSAKELIEYFAVMGYSMMMLYTEDTVKIEGLPYFGYMRGGYTEDEIREIDDYADSFGIELVPCIECYGHMERYLIWPAATKIKDTPSVLMAREPETIAFLDKWIGTVSRLFRSRKIHIGMDEAHDMGRGRFMDKHGYVPSFELFNEYMSDLMKIVNKYGLSPMMWSDMYFRVNSRDRQSYYERETVIPEETKKKIPENMKMVFWYYGESEDPGDVDDFMLKKHNDLGREVMTATGAWSWAGHFPEFNLMEETNRRSLKACRDNGVNEAMLTIWSNDNAECDYFANLLSLSYFAELCYNPNAIEKDLKERFEETTGGDYELFKCLSYYHMNFEDKPVITHRDQRFLGKSLFWQDVLSGLYDYELWQSPRSEHYDRARKIYSGEHTGKWAHLYDYAYKIMDYLHTKTYIAENLVPIYKSGDKTALSDMANVHLPALIEKCRAVHRAHKGLWRRSNKVQGWQNMDVRYGGIVARCECAIEYIQEYLSGTIQKIDELETERLPLKYHPYITYLRASTPNQR